MTARILALLALSLCSRFAHAGEPSDYVRYQEDKASARLEVAIKTFALPSGQKVDLIGVVHIADAAYYQELNRRFAGYDAVLFELVGDPAALTMRSPGGDQSLSGGHPVTALQQAASRYLKLSFQLDAVDYTGRNMVHADATQEEFAKMQQERGENLMTLFTRAMQAQLRRDLDPRVKNELDTFALIRILLSEDSALEFKKALAKSFDQMEAMSAAMEGAQGSAILSGRNDVVVRKAKEMLAKKKQRHIAVFYGGAHMPGIEAALLNEMKGEAVGEEWLAAWTMPAGM